MIITNCFIAASNCSSPNSCTNHRRKLVTILAQTTWLRKHLRIYIITKSIIVSTDQIRYILLLLTSCNNLVGLLLLNLYRLLLHRINLLHLHLLRVQRLLRILRVLRVRSLHDYAFRYRGISFYFWIQRLTTIFAEISRFLLLAAC